MLKIALGQMEVIPGRPDQNTKIMLDMISQARCAGTHLIVFPEMAIPGYLLGDTWEQKSFLTDCEKYGHQIIKAAAGICVIFGNVGIDWTKTGNDGRVRKYNSCFIAQNGELLGGKNFPYPYRIKTLHPNYREFDDNRHFFSLPQLALELGATVEKLLQPVQLTIDKKIINLGCLLCEDGWVDDYLIKPMAALSRNHKIDLFVNISSSPFTLGKNDKRNRVFSAQVTESKVPLIYVNSTGIQNNGKTVYTFDGNSSFYNCQGEITAFCSPFEQELKYVTLDLNNKGNRKENIQPPDDWSIESIHQSLTYGLNRFLKSINMKKAVIGISGGIDSAVGSCLYAQILGPENVLLVNMPSIFNSQTTKTLAARLAQNLGCHYTVVPIQEAVDFTVKQVSEADVTALFTGESFHLTVSPFVKENIQARDRSARILAALAASFGGGFTCNANKSEMTVGYSTLYGDLAGFLAATGDLWKHQVYALAEYLNGEVYHREVIPREIINLVPSAELSFEQSIDEGKGDPINYPYHDYLFRSFVEHWNRATPEDILKWYAEGILEEKIGCAAGLVNKIFPGPKEFIEDLERWWGLYTGMAVAKRIQAPPVLAVSRRAFGFDHREAQNGPYFSSPYNKLKKRLIRNPE